MLNGKDPVHLQAYHNAIVIQNHFLSQVRVLPVIGLHPKAMTQMIQLAPEDTPATMSARRYKTINIEVRLDQPAPSRDTHLMTSAQASARPQACSVDPQVLSSAR
jgi:hypothetical protein